MKKIILLWCALYAANSFSMMRGLAAGSAGIAPVFAGAYYHYRQSQKHSQEHEIPFSLELLLNDFFEHDESKESSANPYDTFRPFLAGVGRGVAPGFSHIIPETLFKNRKPSLETEEQKDAANKGFGFGLSLYGSVPTTYALLKKRAKRTVKRVVKKTRRYR